MAGKEVTGEGLSANIAGMSKNQLYDIMCQMKKLMEQNEKQARQILIQNPTLARDLFQAQILLGMVRPSQPMSAPTPTTQSTQPMPSHVQQSSNQAVLGVSAQLGLQDQMRKQPQSQPPLAVPSTIAPSLNLPPPPLPSPPLQPPKGHASATSAPTSLPQSAQVLNMPPLPHHSAAQPPPPHHHQPHMPSAPSQLDQSIQTSGVQHLPLQPPLPPHMRPPMQPFPQQIHPQMGPNVGFQQSGAQMHHSQPMFHAAKPPAPMGPSFMQGQPPLPSQLPPQSLYQGGSSHMRTDFNQVGNSMQADRGSSWIPGLPENTTPVPQLPGPPPPFPGQMGLGNQPARQQPLTPEMEHALLQQVMSLTPEQINSLPPEQRNQVLQLQQMLRK